MSRLSSCVTAALLLLAPAGRAEGEEGRAEALFRAGVHLFKAGKHREALEQFREARAIAPGADVIWSIARCHEVLGEWDEALAAFEDFQAMTKDPSARAEARRKIAAVRWRVFGRLRVEVSVPGSSVEVDGVAAGVAPLPQSLELRHGTHRVVARKAGHEAAEATVEVRAGGEEAVRLVLSPVQAGPREVTPAPMPGTVTGAARPAAPPESVQVVAAPSPPPRRWSPLKAGLFFGGVGAVVAGVALQVAGFERFRRMNESGDYTYAEKRDARELASGLGYGAYALYGTGAAAIVASFLVPSEGRHPLGVGFQAVPGGGGTLSLSGRW